MVLYVKNFFEETITYLSTLSAQEAVERKEEDTVQKKLAEAYAAQYEKLETTVYIRAFRDCWNFFCGLSECE